MYRPFNCFPGLYYDATTQAQAQSQQNGNRSILLCLCLCLRRCVVRVNRDDASISTSTSTRRLCLRRTGLHVGFLCLCLRRTCKPLRRTCKPFWITEKVIFTAEKSNFVNPMNLSIIFPVAWYRSFWKSFFLPLVKSGATSRKKLYIEVRNTVEVDNKSQNKFPADKC